MSVESQIVQIVLAFLVLINPLSALPLFLELTHTCSRRERRRVAQMTAASVFVTIVIFTFSGNLLLKVLGISTGSFRVGGGILVFLIAMSMMSKGDNHAKPDLTTPDDGSGMPAEKREIRPVLGTIAVVPLAIPMIMGPGGISTVVIYASSVSSYTGLFLITAAGAVVSLISYLSLLAADRISGLLGDTGLAVLNRIMGILLAAVAVEIIVAGLRSLFPQLAA
ncbi:MarC family protein [Kingella sp. SNUBH-2017]|uniref:MarC family protein n=1 Tax=Kingella sp. SNUBH-2017 TaxID=2994077 RepID=UPI00236410AD|nr:MarC family protein [Kingella sp. SNUBH-2017]MDD2183284.1 MarC family protein [Kingella sp. SNUBH-2017]